MQEKNDFNYNEHNELPDSLTNISNVASVTETTGLMPTPPHNAHEMSSYQDLASMEIKKEAPGKNDNAEIRRARRINGQNQHPRV